MILAKDGKAGSEVGVRGRVVVAPGGNARVDCRSDIGCVRDEVGRSTDGKCSVVGAEELDYGRGGRGALHKGVDAYLARGTVEVPICYKRPVEQDDQDVVHCAVGWLAADQQV